MRLLAGMAAVANRRRSRTRRLPGVPRTPLLGLALRLRATRGRRRTRRG